MVQRNEAAHLRDVPEHHTRFLSLIRGVQCSTVLYGRYLDIQNISETVARKMKTLSERSRHFTILSKDAGRKYCDRIDCPLFPSRFRLHTSGDAEAAAAGHTELGIVLSDQVKASLLDWTPADGLICVVRLATSVRKSGGSEVHRTLFIVTTCDPTEYSPESVEDSFHDTPCALLQQPKRSDIVVVSGDMSARVKLSIRADREAWWTRKAQEMKDARNAGKVQELFHLTCLTVPRKPLVSERIRDQNGPLIRGKAERLDRWARYFELPAAPNPESWPSAGSFNFTASSNAYIHGISVSQHQCTHGSFSFNDGIKRCAVHEVIVDYCISPKTSSTKNSIAGKFGEKLNQFFVSDGSNGS
ncbi:hypothetical protein CLF_109648 [Clonorchis sinensis]|uniref:Uncharacterized protein n=1 Tax=Clonorchis sinensis TaxID=79923 RepID=G7YJM5_CLOSI|nr:hypothetical protein CLF_109648 [Clonorchis sinensis]